MKEKTYDLGQLDSYERICFKVSEVSNDKIKICLLYTSDAADEL